MQIHINRDGQNFGPYSLDEVRQYLASGNIVVTDLAWYEGAPGWMPLGQVPGVAPAARPAGQAPAAAALAAPAAVAVARPAAVSRAPVAQSHAAGERRPAGFWKRALALIVDYLVLVLVSLGIGFAIGVMLALGGGSGSGFGWFTYLLGLFLGWLYFALMESSSGQATIGKRVVGIVVTDLNGERIGFGRASGRYFGKILSTLILLVGYLMAALTERKQGLHDMLAGTLVLNREADARDLPGWAIALILLPVVAVPVLGILLAIAIPAYSDYSDRARVAEMLSGASSAKLAITEFVLSNDRLPESFDELGVTGEVAGARLSLVQGVLVLTRTTDGRTLGLEPYRTSSGQVVWRCGNAAPPAGADDIANGDASDYTLIAAGQLPIACR